jgi:hypothetical protein
LAQFEKDGMRSIFSIEEVSDTGEAVFSPMPVKDFPLVHYLNLDYADTK